MRELTPTLSQTVGPYFHLGLSWLFDSRVADLDVPGLHLTLRGQVLDGDGAPVPDALIEIWQANASGAYVHSEREAQDALVPKFRGAARVATDDAGAFSFTTIKPGCVPAPESGLQAPHISVQIFMRGLLRPLLSRIYFADEPANVDDFVLTRVPAARRQTLLALPRSGESNVYEWNVVLQGPNETVFFDG
jgi:protocatechuate 3,4-dioxygenase alpha subunit